jgi:tetratricopeptide (TPR) repeat protein
MAIQEYNRVIQLQASHSDALKNLAYLMYQFNRLDESGGLYRRALALHADDPELLSAVAATNIHRVWPDLAAAGLE